MQDSYHAGQRLGLRGVRGHELGEALRHPSLQRLLRLLQAVGQAKAHLQVVIYV